MHHVFECRVRPHASLHTLVLALALASTATFAADNFAYVGEFGSAGSGNGEFLANGLNFIAIDPIDHTIVVSDGGNNRVQIFDANGNYLRQFGAGGTGNGEFAGVGGVTTDPISRDIYAADENGRLEVFRLDGTFVRQIGQHGSGMGEFLNPGSIAIDPASGNVYASDFTANRVEVFSSAGLSIGSFGANGTGDGQFLYAEYLAIDPVTRNMLVSDASRNDIQIFTPSGQFVRRFGGFGAGNGEFGAPGPGGVTVDPTTHEIIVADYGNNRVQIFDQDGNYLTQFGSLGSGAGQFNGPTGVAVDTVTHRLIVEDRTNVRIELFDLTNAPAPPVCGTTPVQLWLTPPTFNATTEIGFFAQAAIEAPFAGTMSFVVDGAGNACTANMSDVDASCEHALQPGAHTIVAQYSGDGHNPAGCSAPLTINVSSQAATVPTGVECVQPPPTQQGQSLPLQCNAVFATERSLTGGAPPPEGYLRYSLGDATLAVVPLFAGAAAYSAPMSGGSYAITVSYSDDADNEPSSVDVPVVVQTPSDDIFYGAFDPLPQ